MKYLLIFLLVATVFLCSPVVSFAQDSPTPTPQPQVRYTNEFTTQNQPLSVVTLLKNFINGFDSFLGGFIFYTPDPLAGTIVLKDKTEIPGITKYRDMFLQIAIPILAIIIAIIAISKLGSDNVQELKSFALRFLVAIVMFITVPYALSYSIQANNLLVDKISNTQNITTFLSDYFDKAQTQIDSGASAESFGIPSFDISLQSGVLQSLGKFVVQILLFALTFVFLLVGFLYIGFQFVIRFATLLFLGVLYPIIIPFVLSAKTESVVHTFFRMWTTALIQQPAFVLGFAIATDVFTAILNSKGPSVGMLFFYTGFLFFLGGVNMLVARIFGDSFTAMSNNMQAMIATRSVSAPVTSAVRDFKRGLIGGSIATSAGQSVRNNFDKSKHDPYDSAPKSSSTDYEGLRKLTNHQSSDNYSSTKEAVIPPFSKNISGNGLKVAMENPKQGVVAVSGEAYQYEDKKSGLTSIYPNRIEAVQDGVPEDKLNKISLDKSRFIDLSSFSASNPNPHNYNAMQESQKAGHDIGYAFINDSAPPVKVKHFLDVAKARNDAYGIRGVIVKRQGKNTSDQIIRMYTANNL